MGDDGDSGVRRPVQVGADGLFREGGGVVNQGHWGLAHSAAHFLVPPVSHQQDALALPVVLLGFIVDAGDQRADGVDDPQVAGGGAGEIVRGRAVGGEYHQGAFRGFVHILNGDGAFAFQLGHHIGVVDNLMLDIHRRPEPFQAQLHDLNGAHHAGAETAGRTEHYFNHIVSSIWSLLPDDCRDDCGRQGVGAAAMRFQRGWGRHSTGGRTAPW